MHNSRRADSGDSYATPHHTRVSRTYVPSSLLECKELRPVSELESRSPEGSTAFRMDLAKDLAAAAAAPTDWELEPSAASPFELLSAAVRFLGTAPLCCCVKSSGGSGGRSGVAMMRSLSLKRTLFSELLDPLLLPEELPGLPVASLLVWN